MRIGILGELVGEMKPPTPASGVLRAEPATPCSPAGSPTSWRRSPSPSPSPWPSPPTSSSEKRGSGSTSPGTSCEGSPTSGRCACCCWTFPSTGRWPAGPSEETRRRGPKRRPWPDGSTPSSTAFLALDRRLGEALKTSPAEMAARNRARAAPTVLQSSWQQLQAGTSDMSTSQALHADLLVGIRMLIVQVGDASQLILDPDLDSYYVMDGLLLKEPDLVDRLRRQSREPRAPGAGRWPRRDRPRRERGGQTG